MKSLFSASVPTIAMAQQSMGIVVSPPWEGRNVLPEKSSGFGSRPF
jgi:hypothetical protein